MNYGELYTKTKESYVKSGTPGTIYDGIMRLLSFYATPPFLMLKISADAATFLGLATLLAAALSASFLGYTGFIMAVCLFFISELLDYVDGNIARFMNTPSFYGKYMEGVLGLLGWGMFRIGLARAVYVRDGFDSLLMWAAVISAVLTPMHHLIYDRYSAFARWINEEKQTKVKPNIRKEMWLPLMNLLEDIQFLCLALSVFFFHASLWLYFIINISMALICIFYHNRAAYINMKVRN